MGIPSLFSIKGVIRKSDCMGLIALKKDRITANRHKPSLLLW